MKRMMIWALGLTLLATSATSMAAGPCVNKQKALETELEYAKAYGNRHRVAGLERALANVKTYCVDANEVRDQQYKADKQRIKIKEVELDIQQAQTQGRADKAQKKRLKLEKEQLKLQQIINEYPGVK